MNIKIGNKEYEYNQPEMFMDVLLSNGETIQQMVMNTDDGRKRIEEWKRDGGFWKNVENSMLPTYFNFNSIVKITFHGKSKTLNHFYKYLAG